MLGTHSDSCFPCFGFDRSHAVPILTGQLKGGGGKNDLLLQTHIAPCLPCFILFLCTFYFLSHRRIFFSLPPTFLSSIPLCLWLSLLYPVITFPPPLFLLYPLPPFYSCGSTFPLPSSSLSDSSFILSVSFLSIVTLDLLS